MSRKDRSEQDMPNVDSVCAQLDLGGTMTVFNHSTRIFSALILACGTLATFPAFAQVPSTIDDKALATALRSGGFVIVVRHGATFPDQADTDPFHLDTV